MRRLGRGPSERRTVLGLVLAAGFLPCLLGASTPAPAPCTWNEAPRVVFDVADRADLARHVPGLATDPMVAGDPILLNGKPAGLEGRLHVTVYDCLPGGSIPMHPPLTREPAALPTVFRNIVVVQKLDGDAWWFAEVNVTGMTP